MVLYFLICVLVESVQLFYYREGKIGDLQDDFSLACLLLCNNGSDHFNV